jgi:hypothetical protein
MIGLIVRVVEIVVSVPLFTSLAGTAFDFVAVLNFLGCFGAIVVNFPFLEVVVCIPATFEGLLNRIVGVLVFFALHDFHSFLIHGLYKIRSGPKTPAMVSG